MVNGLLPVGRNQEHTIILCAHPLPVGTIYGHTRNGQATEQIVGQAAAVVAVHLNLGEMEIVAEDCFRIVYHKETQCCSEPYPSVQVLADTIEFIRVINRSILIRDAAVHDALVVLIIAQRTLGIHAKDALPIQTTAGNEYQSAAVQKDIVAERSLLYGLVIQSFPLSVGPHHPENSVVTGIKHPQVALPVVCYTRT